MNKLAVDRERLKELYRDRDDIQRYLVGTTNDYIESLGKERGIYISDHAIVRYLERVKGVEFPETLLTDKDRIDYYSIITDTYIGYIRHKMLNLNEDREILRNYKALYRKNNYTYVIKELTIVTVLLN